ncbi:hypothetical protein, conserved [Babesia bigemina]|uniref:Uncharacterized protein n=1 Tax=Babesia bigemina TaxID=5866 RepID=A0A061D6L8_BABBI|nr:hypothetical protein, conserved [Babesia bigemina]CDR96203.1 hypothetical protein, conserved [Babesia bigemina]|eukprot:XP_012768389.1 hypothetical protein, conserved [Babesia bigemina]
MEAYKRRCIKRYQYCDLASAIFDGYLVYYIVRQVDITGRSKAMIEIFATWFRIVFVVKVLLHLLVVPVFVFTGSVSKICLTIIPYETESIMPIVLPDAKSSSSEIPTTPSARAVLTYKYTEKAKLLFQTFGLVCFTALLLTLDHYLHRLLDITLMAMWFCAVSSATQLHYVYFRDYSPCRESKQGESELLHPRIKCMWMLYTVTMIAGWSFGNYLALLDWDEPYIFFPNANFIGMCLGHLAAAILTPICSNV